MTQDTPKTEAAKLAKSLKTLFQSAISMPATSDAFIIDNVNSILDIIEFDPVKKALGDDNIGHIIDVRDSNRRTALLIAANGNHTETVQRLLTIKSADVNAQSWHNGWTTLMYAAKYGHTEIVRRLLAFDSIDVYTQDDDGKTALDIANNHGHTKIAELIQGHISLKKAPDLSLAEGPA